MSNELKSQTPCNYGSTHVDLYDDEHTPRSAFTNHDDEIDEQHSFPVLCDSQLIHEETHDESRCNIQSPTNCNLNTRETRKQRNTTKQQQLSKVIQPGTSVTPPPLFTNFKISKPKKLRMTQYTVSKGKLTTIRKNDLIERSCISTTGNEHSPSNPTQQPPSIQNQQPQERIEPIIHSNTILRALLLGLFCGMHLQWQHAGMSILNNVPVGFKSETMASPANNATSEESITSFNQTPTTTTRRLVRTSISIQELLN
ncbi:hypothetical protein C9374_010989 [Naegleria lovaniensis]|uniref:Uncharacterized protein n=1 Tax=Naegleria lovaniensis TaxID=51637 RepID=A0AA88KIP5_NAELO|nr:uncharacterized protein C9374_010989 [Naegleria lovaniensis]KAG2374152.1 hypothetical protein C9374_010989 [Naegleria lovaniensis]